MLVAALPLYVRGERLAIPARESVGVLVIERDRPNMTTVATLSNSRALGAHPKHSTVLPPLYEPTVKTLVNGRIDIRGIEREGKAWHLQLWSCRLVMSLESEVIHRTPGLLCDGLEAIYLRWWALVWEAANRHGENKGMQIADIADLVEAPIEEIWPFLDWSGRTQRSVACLGGKDGLGSISLRSLQGCFPTGEVPTAQSQSLVGS